MKIDHIKPTINQDAVFQIIGCSPEDSSYSTMLSAYQELLPEIFAWAECSCVFEMGTLQNADVLERCEAGNWVIYAISTVGKKLSSLSSEYFAQGEYVKGILADAMADSILFEMEQSWMQNLKSFCRWKKIGISKRLESPYDLPMSVQKTAYEYLQAKKLLGMEITSANMYDPVKSSCVVFVVSEDSCQFHAGHDCRTCPAVKCKMRRVLPVEIKVLSQGETSQILCEDQESILTAYQHQTGRGSAVCGGRGTCGKCKIRVISGELAITDSDRDMFSQKELEAGYRLACRAYPKEACTIEVCFQDETKFEVLRTFAGEQKTEQKEGHDANDAPQTSSLRTGIALDIGTTTLAAQLINLSSGKSLAAASAINRQRIHGADVIARIEASTHGKGEKLRQLIRGDVEKLVQQLLKKSGVSADSVEKMVISGNTTMGHLLMGYSCEGLGVFPFHPVNIDIIYDIYSNIFASSTLNCGVWLMPGISAYVGGDIVSGLYACDFPSDESIHLFIDLGTNGEMALGNHQKLLTTSVAAGPAFEGGNISCGTGSIPGAISHVTMDEKRRIRVETIQDQTPLGICGTGIIELVSALFKAGLIDETGLLSEDYFEEGYPVVITPDGNEITFTQKDIREVQMAKSAVRAGVEILIRRYGIDYEDIQNVYLAGGMGFTLSREAAVSIGLLPAQLKEKISAVGNSSLAGAVRALTDESWQSASMQLKNISQEIILANETEFNEYYVKYMMFG
ncbi:MAG: ASKHA domain-containing protein [Brotaphodocola sp.]